MKKILATTFVAVAMTGVSSIAMAGDNTGCGLGSMMFEGRKGVLTDVLAATTNGSFGNQTFGMSSGTSGCKKDVPIEHRSFTLLVQNNYEEMAMAIAKADTTDEVIVSAANELQTTPEHFINATNSHFDAIFTPDAEYVDIATRIKEVI